MYIYSGERSLSLLLVLIENILGDNFQFKILNPSYDKIRNSNLNKKNKIKFKWITLGKKKDKMWN